MKYDFDQLIDRDTTHSTKWLKFSDPDVLPMWIADMDFLCPPEVTNPMIERVNQGIFGYTDTPISLTKLFIEHVHKTIGWNIEEDWIVWVPGGVVGLNISCKTVLAPGDIALVPSPIYPPFTEAPENMERGFVKTFLKDINGRLEFDVEDIKELLSDDAKMLYLCNPQNPGGTVFTNRELEDLSTLCQENDIVVCSDEIHADLILDDNLKHTPYASLNSFALENSITIMGPCKTFNLAGFPIAAAIIPNEELREDFERNSKGIVAHIDTMAFVAAEAAYRSAIEWKSELVEYLKTNKSLLSKSINDIEGLSLCGPEAGFLAWIDCRQSGLDSPVKFFVEEAKVGVHGGEFFGNEKYVRLNFVCPRSILEEAISRIEKAFSQRK